MKPPSVELTQREKDVLICLASGYTTRQMALSFNLSASVLNRCTTALRRKFDACNSPALVHISHARGYLTADNGPPRCDLCEADVRYLRLIAAGETMNTHARRYGLLKRMGAKNSPHAVHLGWCWNYLSAGP